jgi:hypothetical protein
VYAVRVDNDIVETAGYGIKAPILLKSVLVPCTFAVAK